MCLQYRVVPVHSLALDCPGALQTTDSSAAHMMMERAMAGALERKGRHHVNGMGKRLRHGDQWQKHTHENHYNAIEDAIQDQATTFQYIHADTLWPRQEPGNGKQLYQSLVALQRRKNHHARFLPPLPLTTLKPPKASLPAALEVGLRKTSLALRGAAVEDNVLGWPGPKDVDVERPG